MPAVVLVFKVFLKSKADFIQFYEHQIKKKKSADGNHFLSPLSFKGASVTCRLFLVWLR